MTLATVPKNMKKSKPVQLSRATYNVAAFTVTLFTRKPLLLNPPLELTVKAASLLDALGRELDGNNSGQSGANLRPCLATLAPESRVPYRSPDSAAVCREWSVAAQKAHSGRDRQS